MKRAFLLIIFLLTCFQILAQDNPTVDSLINVLKYQKEDSNKLRTYRLINDALVYTDPRKDIDFLLEATLLARKLDDKQKEAFFTKVTGACYNYIADYDKALYYYLQSARMFEQQKDYKSLSEAYGSIADIYFRNRALDKARLYTDKTLNIIEFHTRDSVMLLGIYLIKAQIFDVSQQYDSALHYATIVRNIDFQNAAGTGAKYLSTDYMQLGLIYKHKMNTTAALQYLDSAKYILDTIADRRELEQYYGSLYNNIAATQVQAGNYTEAYKNFLLSIEAQKKLHDMEGMMENYRNMAEMYGKMKDYKQQAAYLQKYYDLKDSLFNTDKKVKMTELEADYEMEKKNAVLAHQEAETAHQKNQRNIFLFSTVGVMLLLAAMFIFYRRIQTKNILLASQNIQINEQKEELQILNGVKDRLFSIISHDLRNPLASLRTYLSITDNPDLPEDKRTRYRQQIQQAVSHTGNMLDNLLIWANMQIKNTAPARREVNVEDCVDDAIADVQAQALHKNIAIGKDIAARLATADAAILGIVLRNLLTNAVKYSYADSHIQIRSQRLKDQLYLTVEDYGLGMSPEKIQELSGSNVLSTSGTSGEKGSGLGLFLIKELLRKMQGALHIESEAGKGSRFTVQLPAVVPGEYIFSRKN